MDKVRTVSETKREFYSHHNRPINSIYRRFIEELMVEMHLLSVNVDFRYDAIYALGVVTSFERFMQGYRPEAAKDSIFAALCQSVGGDSQQYRQDAQTLLISAKEMSVSELIAKIEAVDSDLTASSLLLKTLQAIANNPQFKYSRLWAIGLYTLMAEVDTDLLKNEEKRHQTLQKLTEALHLPPDKLQKDLDLYRSNLDKMDQLLTVLEEALEAERKKRQKETTTELTKEEFSS